MGDLLRDHWAWELAAFLFGALITWVLLPQREPALPRPPAEEKEEEERVLVTAGAPPEPASEPTQPRRAFSTPEPAPGPGQPRWEFRGADPEPGVAETGFSQQMEQVGVAGPAAFGVRAGDGEVAEGKYGPGSADAVPHQGPPDGFRIKGVVGSMLFHTPQSPDYGRTRPDVWFRTEADAVRAGFAHAVRRPRRTPVPRRDDQN
ncbi:hypothetical protein Kfla_4950 [Kribbella flavida DSM 17836]|uniref:Uncharacterized protein n=1 Tax=Kribbella flavida (strain DSM 17836 / JCM 10339 / NBRC 14399) TaxID=479435 RepID=D2Q220_KRIFD|nr:hypothetical protein [Kribbella flavida]ADB33966.1 hypothetical protein Kfla_4950 [Kribbella flavida DSM 17836]